MHIWRALFFAIIHWGNTQGKTLYHGNVELTQATSLWNCCSPLTCRGFKYDLHRNSCCDDKVYKGAGLCCCGRTPYNSIQDTCCEGNLTKGLSELVSLCCSSVAYNPLNEICCGSHVYPRTAHTECCRNGEWTRLDNSTNSSSKNTEIFLLVSGTQALPQIAIWNSSFNLIVKSLMMHKSLESSMNVIVFSYSVWTDVCLCF
ncbi:galaxin-2-like [Arapaima gigas]